jgi:hypothetical protein
MAIPVGSGAPIQKGDVPITVVLKRGLGKDGCGSYVAQFPTRYFWVGRVKRIAQRIANKDGFREEIWVNTYVKHPPAFPRPHCRWMSGGSGVAVGSASRSSRSMLRIHS